MSGNTKKDKENVLKENQKNDILCATISIYTDFSSEKGDAKDNGTISLKC